MSVHLFPFAFFLYFHTHLCLKDQLNPAMCYMLSHFSRVWLFRTLWTVPNQLLCPGKNTGVGCHALLQVIIPTQELNPGLPLCRQILYKLSHKESPSILKWLAYPFSSGSSQPRNQTGVSCIAGGFFTNWATSFLFHLLFFCISFIDFWSNLIFPFLLKYLFIYGRVGS